ncbi:MAG: amino acid adenylation protein, partial [Proteobacteria bacterium]|nr:amino acid adenylation protein [Pseudomonadota bacterium]
GYRIELGEIEARLAGLAGVRAAGCRLQGDGGMAELVGFVVPADPAAPPAPDALRAELAKTLPGYMVPRQLGLIDELPTTVSGKLDRAALPELAIEGPLEEGEIVAPEGEVEEAIARAAADILKRPAGVSVEADFFEGLGGDSLSAAMLVTLLREDARADWITVSDIYEARTIRELAKRAARHTPSELSHEPLVRVGEANVALANLVQGGWLMLLLLLGAWGGWLVAFRLFPALFAGLGMIGFVLLLPLVTALAVGAWIPVSVLLAMAVKRLLIGTYREIRAPVWSPWYLRHWLTVQAARLIPWPVLQGTGLQIAVLRALGARIGEGVHIARGVDLRRGGWDLLDLGDDVSLGVDAYLGLVELDRGDVVVRPVRLGDGVTLQTRAGVCGSAAMEAGSQLTALSVLNRRQVAGPGELWGGVPAEKLGMAPPRPQASGPAMSRHRYDTLLLLVESLVALLVALPGELLALAACRLAGVGVAEVWRWAYHPTITGRVAALVLGLTVLTIPVALVWSALLMRLMGRVRPGIIPKFSAEHIRVWIKAGMLRRAGEWLSGTVFWPKWLRLAGMDIGPKCEISTIIDVVPELVTIGAETFFADGIYLGAGHVEAGTVTLGHTRLGRNNFLGNHAVVPPGEVLPDDVLFGISTLAEGAKVPGGGARFGHPSFALPRREVVEVDRSLTHDPSAIRYINRVVWELARFTLPIVPLLLTAAWYAVLANWDGVGGATYALLVIPLATLIPPLGLCLAVLVLKWALIGRVKPGQHALWSCWCSRWDFVYVAWAKWANLVLQRLEGTFLLPAYLRLMGLKLGKRVVLGPEFAQVVDPDMIEIGDYATAAPMFQAHTFEDRVLKVDYVKIGAGATVRHGTVPLYGAVVGEHTHVGPHSVIMKQEHLLPYKAYQGVPTRVFGRED